MRIRYGHLVVVRVGNLSECLGREPGYVGQIVIVPFGLRMQLAFQAQTGGSINGSSPNGEPILMELAPKEIAAANGAKATFSDVG